MTPAAPDAELSPSETARQGMVRDREADFKVGHATHTASEVDFLSIRHLTVANSTAQSWMRVIGLKPLRKFWDRHPDAETPLRLWYRTALHARWSRLQDVRLACPHADAVRTRSGEVLTVFNIGGNKYRLIVRIRYDYELINVRAVLTHAEYDEGKWRD